MTDNIIPREQRVSYSEAEYYLQCRRKHYYGYIRNLTRKSSSIALHRGNVGHEIMDELFTALKDKSLDWDDAKDYLDESAKLYLSDGIIDAETFLLYRQQFEAFVEEYPFKDWPILAVEKRLVAKFHDSLYFPFIVDLVLRSPTREVVLIDHKFTKDFYKPWTLDLNPQLPKYIAAIRSLGSPADSAAYSIFRTGFAKASTPDNIYKIQYMDISDKRVDTAWHEQVEVSDEIQKVKKIYSEAPDYVDAISIRTVNNMMCNSCPFKSICIADYNGWATGPLLKTEYTIKEEQEFTYEQPQE